MASLPDYAELHCLSNFSFLRGASHPEELVERAAGIGYRALALTDECSLAGAVRAHAAAQALGKNFRLILGAEFRLEDEARLVLLATDRRSYAALSTLITAGRRRAAKGRYRLARADVEACAASGLLALHLAGEARWLAERFPGRAWIAVELHCGPDDRGKLDALRGLSRATGLPLVAAGDVHMHLRSRRRLQDALTAIRLGLPVARCGWALHPNAERHLRARVRLAQVYPPELLAETLEVAERCSFSLEELRYEYPEEVVPPGETPANHLARLARDGLAWRYPDGVPEKVQTQVARELQLIGELRYEPFFLTVHDVVRYARSQGILCQGRGSAANSAVCYALGITEVNPEDSELLFERFLSKERREPPDIDVDFEHERREEVIQYIYGKYGRERAALAATVIRYQPRSAARDLGKALGFPPERTERLARAFSWWGNARVLAERLRDAGFDPAIPRFRHFGELLAALVGFPRHLSQHVGGFVISRGPLAELVPVENAAMPGRTVIQWDKNDLESVGLMKVDILALGMLSALRRALALLGMRMQDIPRKDPAVYAMIRKADTIGVFQIESRAQMSMLPRLRPRNLYDLVVEVAIVRPGPIQGEMVHPYLRRRRGEELVDYPSLAVKGVLERTLGVPIFQEQVMQLAMVAAGFTAGQADQLRRAMAAWGRGGDLKPFRKPLIEGMTARGYPLSFAERIYKQIHGFGEYGFPESHAYSFALLAYSSAWLKRHHPAVFCAALLNSQPMGFYSPWQLVQDARRHGVAVLPPDAGASAWDCTLVAGAVRLGLRLVKGLGQDAAARIVAAREAGGFASVEDLARRASLDRGALGSLAAGGALAAVAGHRHQAHWAAAGALPLEGVLREARRDEPPPALRPPREGEDIVADIDSLGLTLGRHPLALLRGRLERLHLLTTEALHDPGRAGSVRTAGLVIGRQQPGTAKGTMFVTLEDETGVANIIVWPDLIARQHRELLGARLLEVEGVLERDGEVVHLVARRLVDRSAWLGHFQVQSRDFH